MDKNTIAGFVLIALVLFGFAWWQQPSAEQLEQPKKGIREDSIAAAKKTQAAKVAAAKQVQQKTAAAADTTALFHTALNVGHRTLH